MVTAVSSAITRPGSRRGCTPQSQAPETQYPGDNRPNNVLRPKEFSYLRMRRQQASNSRASSRDRSYSPAAHIMPCLGRDGGQPAPVSDARFGSVDGADAIPAGCPTGSRFRSRGQRSSSTRAGIRVAAAAGCGADPGQRRHLRRAEQPGDGLALGCSVPKRDRGRSGSSRRAPAMHEYAAYRCPSADESLFGGRGGIAYRTPRCRIHRTSAVRSRSAAW